MIPNLSEKYLQLGDKIHKLPVFPLTFTSIQPRPRSTPRQFTTLKFVVYSQLTMFFRNSHGAKISIQSQVQRSRLPNTRNVTRKHTIQTCMHDLQIKMRRFRQQLTTIYSLALRSRIRLNVNKKR